MRIVLIEPDKVQATIITEALQRNAHQVTQVKSAQLAVQAADEQAPDVVIMELQLAQHNGVEFLYEFRSYPEWLAIPVIVYTHVPVRELAHATTLYRELGVVQVLYKPETTLAALCDAVANVQTADAV